MTFWQSSRRTNSMMISKIQNVTTCSLDLGFNNEICSISICLCAAIWGFWSTDLGFVLGALPSQTHAGSQTPGTQQWVRSPQVAQILVGAMGGPDVRSNRDHCVHETNMWNGMVHKQYVMEDRFLNWTNPIKSDIFEIFWSHGYGVPGDLAISTHYVQTMVKYILPWAVATCTTQVVHSSSLKDLWPDEGWTSSEDGIGLLVSRWCNGAPQNVVGLPTAWCIAPCSFEDVWSTSALGFPWAINRLCYSQSLINKYQS